MRWLSRAAVGRFAPSATSTPAPAKSAVAVPTANATVVPTRVPTATTLPAAPTSTSVPTSVPTPTTTPGPSVVIGDVVFSVEIAETAAERQRGLSGMVGLKPRMGMLFTSRFGSAPTIWMKGVLMSLDLVWISEECVVVKITADAPAPTEGMADSELPRYDVPSAAHVFEIGGGVALESGVGVGDEVRFMGLGGEAEGLCE